MLKTTTNLDDEFLKVWYLHDYLRNTLKEWPKEYQLLQQADDLILSTFIIRSGGILKHGDERLAGFPFSKGFEGKKIAVYGAGTFGQQLVRRLKDDNHCQIVTWIDDDYWEYRRCCMNVDSIQQICKVDYDAIVIALIDPVQITKIKSRLFDYGVEEKKIITVSATREQRDEALKLYLREAYEISNRVH